MLVERSDARVVLTLPSDREIRFSREFDFPRELLFEAWTTPEHVRNWWGCNGSSVPVCEIDLRPGGTWRWVLRMGEGNDHPFRGVYREIVVPERLVYTECYENPAIGNPEWLTTVTFEDLGDGRSRLTSNLLHASKEMRDGHLQSGMEEGLRYTLDRLAEVVAGLRGGAAAR